MVVPLVIIHSKRIFPTIQLLRYHGLDTSISNKHNSFLDSGRYSNHHRAASQEKCHQALLRAQHAREAALALLSAPKPATQARSSPDKSRISWWFNRTLWWFNGDFMVINRDFMAIYRDFMVIQWGFYGDLMGFYDDLMGILWWILWCFLWDLMGHTLW